MRRSRDTRIEIEKETGGERGKTIRTLFDGGDRTVTAATAVLPSHRTYFMRLRREIIVAARGVQAFSNFGVAIYRSIEIGPPDLLYVVGSPATRIRTKRSVPGRKRNRFETGENGCSGQGGGLVQTSLLLYRVPGKPIGRELIATFVE